MDDATWKELLSEFIEELPILGCRGYNSDSIVTANSASPFRGVMDDYLRRERAIKTVIFASLRLRRVCNSLLYHSRDRSCERVFRREEPRKRRVREEGRSGIRWQKYVSNTSETDMSGASEDPLAGPVSGMIEER
jgi:hypothetical protein